MATGRIDQTIDSHGVQSGTSTATPWFALGRQPRPRRHGDVEENELDGEIVLFDPRSSRTYRFNETAFFVWRACKGDASVAEIGRLMSDRYDIDRAEALDHADQLVTAFASAGLLEGESGA